MENLILYLVKSSGLIGMFFLAYYLLLRKETFFNSNLWFLLAGLFTAVGLPFLIFTKIILVENNLSNLDLSNSTMIAPIQNEAFEINWYLVSGIVYILGILFFLAKFAIDFRSLSKVLKGKTVQHQADFKFFDLTENIAPFSYFNTIVYNSSLYSKSELENILEHEKTHSEQNHTVDVLISRLFCIAFWFNPLVWLYSKAIIQNLEYIADSEASKGISDKKAYQITLLKITTQENCVAITNHFNQSLIKKRIIMLNKNQSNKRNSWKYAVVIPALVAFIFFFQVKVIAQETESKQSVNELTKATEKEIFINGSKVSQVELDQLDPTEIKSMNVTKKPDKATIQVVTNEFSKKPIIFINGKRTNTTMEDLNIMDPNLIESMNVVKGKSATDKYGKEGVNGVVEIITKGNGQISTNTTAVVSAEKDNFINGKKVSQSEMDQLDPKEIKHMDINNKSKKETIRVFTNEYLKKSTIYINGEKTKVTIADLDQKDQNLIKTMNVIKGKEAQAKYGKDGRYGVIEITTKGNVDLLQSTKKSK